MNIDGIMSTADKRESLERLRSQCGIAMQLIYDRLREEKSLSNLDRVKEITEDCIAAAEIIDEALYQKVAPML